MLKKVQIIIILIVSISTFGLIGCGNKNNTVYAPIPPAGAKTPVASLIKIESSIPYAPALNQPIDVTCTVSSIYDFSNIIIKITTRRRVISQIDANIEHPYIPGENITRTFNLKANEPISFSSKIAFKENGFWRITASVGGNEDDLYITINGDQGIIGWSLPTPPIIPEIPPEPPPAVILDNSQVR